MSDIAQPPFDFFPGTTPLLVSMPHPGLQLPVGMGNRLTETARALPDTDWHIPRLYDFARDMGAGILAARYSRFAVDLNRPADDKPLYQTATTGLFPTTLFDGTPLFAPGAEPNTQARQRCLEEIWRPYHQTLRDELDRLRVKFGHATLLDAHSIKGAIPRLFDGELPDFNLGTNDGKSCNHSLQDAALAACRKTSYRIVVNGRFKGGFITRHYGAPERGIHAIQLELAQRTYMAEEPPFEFDEERAARVRTVLIRLVRVMIDWHPSPIFQAKSRSDP